MKKQDETRYFVTVVVSVPYKVASKAEMYPYGYEARMGAVEWHSAADGYSERDKIGSRIGIKLGGASSKSSREIHFSYEL